MAPPSTLATTWVRDALDLDRVERRQWLRNLPEGEMVVIANAARRELGSPFALFSDDPVGFVEVVLGERLWSAQREVCESVEANRRTAVPSCHSAGKTLLASRIVAWWGCVWPQGTAQIITTAHRFRQVRFVLWPQIRRAVAKGLPGETGQLYWRVGNHEVAYGFSPDDYDETAFSGIHADRILAVVDEAGALSPTLGQSLDSLMSGDHARLLVIGNPPVDEETSSPWFEEVCNSPIYDVVRIPVDRTPNWTGERMGPCTVCPPEAGTHDARRHLVTKQWSDETITLYGEQSRYVQARVHARFVRGGPRKVIPITWIDEAGADDHQPEASTWVRLGVDVASDGGDELAIARAEGFTVRIVHTSSGEANANVHDVAGQILESILEAERYAREIGSDRTVRVKVDGIGLGWGVVGVLTAWGNEGLHRSEIVGVDVSEAADDSERFINRRAEMWWNTRELLQSVPGGRRATVRLETDRLTNGQLAGPKYGHNSDGRIKIEKKSDLKKRGLPSPDRAEAVLLALYEPGNWGEPFAAIGFDAGDSWRPEGGDVDIGGWNIYDQ